MYSRTALPDRLDTSGKFAENFTKLTYLTQYCAGDKMEKNEMGWACGAYG